MEKLNAVFTLDNSVNDSFNSSSHVSVPIDNGILWYPATSTQTITMSGRVGEEVDSEANKKKIEKRYSSGTPTFHDDLIKFFDNKYKYYQFNKISQGIPRFKANLFRHATSNVFDENVLKAVYNYDGWDRYRCPLEYNLYKTAPDDDPIEGISDGVFFLQYGDTVEQRVVFEQYVTWGGSLVLQAYGVDRELLKRVYKDLTDWMKINNFLKNKKINMYGDFLTLSGETWDDIILDKKLDGMLQKHLINYIAKFDTLKEKKLPTSRGFLLHGNPGTGKSHLGRVLANQLDLTFIWVPYTNEGSHVYSEIFGLARELSPTIVFLEDLASHGGMDRRNNQVSNSLGELLNLLSGIESNAGVITFATENYIDNLDEALKNRPGRFDYILALNNPIAEHRKRLLEKFLPEYPPARIKELCETTSGFSCAHIRELCNRLLIEDDAPENDAVIVLEMRETFRLVSTGD